MKRMHVHISVSNLEESIQFYSGMFANQPTVVKSDYAKWMLDDPRVNFTISQRGLEVGLNHLGIQVESAEELAEMQQRLNRLPTPVLEQADAYCCYANSDKYWIKDPSSIAWEAFHTLGSIPVYGQHTASSNDTSDTSSCCVPLSTATETSSMCGAPAKSENSSKVKCC
jgi:hypothetical protein